MFKAGQQTIDGAALRYSPPSLRGAADDPSLRNQLQQLFLSEDAGRPSNWALKSRDNSCSSPPLALQTRPQRKASPAAVKYLFTVYLHSPLGPSWSDKSATLNTQITSRPKLLLENQFSLLHRTGQSNSLLAVVTLSFLSTDHSEVRVITL